MRITQNSIYNAAQSRLGTLIEEYNEANRVVTTGKKINRLSDDPMGISSVVNLRSSLANLDQLTDNIHTASTWLATSESTLDGIKTILEDSKAIALSMRNDTMTNTERLNAAAQIKQALEQVLELANTQVQGQYLFSGTKTDTKPFAFDDPDNPTAVIYSGNNNQFTLKTGKDAGMPVSYNGSSLFDSQLLTVDGTNNKIDFLEDKGGGFGNELAATIDPGDYSREELATAIQNALNTASEDADPGNGITYQVTYDDATGYTIQSATGTDITLLWDSGANAAQSVAPEIGFSETDTVSILGATGSDQAVDWSLFKTLFDFRDYLQSSDTAGIDRSMSRIDTQFNNIVNEISQIGYKGTALDLKTTVIEDLSLTYTKRKSEIEEADIIEAITTLSAKESAYKAALASTAKVMSVSLLDYL